PNVVTTKDLPKLFPDIGSSQRLAWKVGRPRPTGLPVKADQWRARIDAAHAQGALSIRPADTSP
ncbi:MAG: hypothetical protein WBM40_21450, partial [Thiohalocapsa sp.]